MKHIFLALTLAVSVGVSAAQAACYADYKAKRDNPLQLHYGVMQVAICDRSQAATEIAPRLARHGWTLLKVLSVFDESGLDNERKSRAGEYYLRY